ncbi:MAG: hypothetical protein IT582_10505 [Opitutaceae bacterium]|nr:hypothetical protein [Opitutaceae bacterium]
MKLLPRLLFGLCLGLCLLQTAAADSPFNGRWKLDPAASTSLDPWSSLEMDIAVTADDLSLVRHYGAGPRIVDETIKLHNQPTAQTISVEGWWDNKHIDAWLANHHQIDVTPAWQDDGRTLVLRIKMVLETQQGDRAVGVTRTLKLDPDGKTLREEQVRESRQLPIVQVYHKL